MKAARQGGHPVVTGAMLKQRLLLARRAPRALRGGGRGEHRLRLAQGLWPLLRRGIRGNEVTEIAPDIYRLSTYNTDANFMFNQFLIVDEEPLLFQTGLRSLFPLVSDALRRVIPVEQLRWITFGHVEADECGSMNQWLAAAPNAQVAHGAMGCMVSVNDLADRPPRPLHTGRSWISETSTCAGSRPLMSPTAGTRGCSMRRRRPPCCAGTCSRRWATARR